MPFARGLPALPGRWRQRKRDDLFFKHADGEPLVHQIVFGDKNREYLTGIAGVLQRKACDQRYGAVLSVKMRLKDSPLPRKFQGGERFFPFRHGHELQVPTR
jgi:hypothetical protein